MLVRQVGAPVLVGCMLAGFGTSTAYAFPPDQVMRSQHPVEQTTAGRSIIVAAPAGAAIGELRRLSGFTWDQLARIFNVSRRSLHFWASGKAMAATNEEHLQRLLSVVRKIDRGSASANRAALLSVREDGSLPLDLLAAGDYDRVLSLLGPNEGRRMLPPKLSEGARAARAPRGPDELVGVLQDRIHREGGTARVARSVRVRGGG
jgi:DNA-binding transcriptional regulator YiaG